MKEFWVYDVVYSNDEWTNYEFTFQVSIKGILEKLLHDDQVPTKGEVLKISVFDPIGFVSTNLEK